MYLSLRGACHPADSLTALATQPISSMLFSLSTMSCFWSGTYSCDSAGSLRTTALLFFCESSNTAHGTLEPLRALPIDANPRLVRWTENKHPVLLLIARILGQALELWVQMLPSKVTPLPAASEIVRSSAFVFLLSFMVSSFSSPNRTVQVPPPRSCLLRPRLPERVSREFPPGLHSSLLTFAQRWSAAPCASYSCT